MTSWAGAALGRPLRFINCPNGSRPGVRMGDILIGQLEESPPGGEPAGLPRGAGSIRLDGGDSPVDRAQPASPSHLHLHLRSAPARVQMWSGGQTR
jgi:hypothetical protein